MRKRDLETKPEGGTSPTKRVKTKVESSPSEATKRNTKPASKQKPKQKPKQKQKQKQKPMEKTVNVQSPQLFGALDKVVRAESLKDVELVLNGKDTVRVHRLVLAALSEPLCRKFEEDPGSSLELTNISDVEAFKQLLDYMYGKQLTITQHNAVPLLTVACLWKVEGLRKSCVDFLTNNINCDNAVEALSVAERLDLPSVAEVAAEFVSKNFPSFDPDFFQRLPDSLFKRIFSRTDLKLPRGGGELEIIDLIFLRAASEPERINALLESCVRIVDLTDEQIVDLSSSPRFQTLERKGMLLDALIRKKLTACANSNKLFSARVKNAAHLHTRAEPAGLARKLLWPFF